MENNITNFIDSMKICTGQTFINSYDLFKAIQGNEELMKKLCEAAIQTYNNIGHIKKFLG